MNHLWIPAKWYTPLPTRVITLQVLHRQEAPVRVGTAAGTARFFQKLPPSRKASAHRVYDPETTVDCVALHDIAYHCPGGNSRGIGYELPGYSKDNDWNTNDMEASMRLCAADVAQDGIDNHIPIEWLTAGDLAAGKLVGITDHVQFTLARIGGNDHTDPGSFFPVGRFLEMVKSAAGHKASIPGGKYNGGAKGLMPTAVLNFITAVEANLSGMGVYSITADGGIRVGHAGMLPSVGAWNYLGLPPQSGDRFFTGIIPNEDGSPGWTECSNDGGRYEFGPGKNGWPPEEK